MSIRDKRAEAARKLTAVQRKVARLRREKGVEIAGTSHDVRISRADIKKMNSRQLLSFIRKAESFTSRRTQFVAGDNGVPLDAKTARGVERKENMLNERHSKIMESIGDFQAPFTGMSLEQRDKQMRPTVRAGGEPFTRTFEPVKTRIQDVRSMEALEALDKWREKQLRPTYARERVNAARDQLNKMLTRTGQEFFKARFNALTDEQFFVLWEYGPYAGEVSLIYEIMKAESEQSELSDADRQIYEDLSYEINEALTWAESITPSIDLGPATNRRAQPGKRARARQRAQNRRAQKRS